MDTRFADTVAAARKGDQSAFETLFARNLGPLRAFIRARVGGVLARQESVEDLAQSVCREVLVDMDGFEYRGDEAFRRWLFLQATRKILHRYEFLTRQKRDVRRDASVDPESAEAAALLEHYASFCTPSQHAASIEEVQRIEALLAELPEDQRDAIAMTRILELPYSDVAEQMGRSESAVRGLVARGLAQLSEKL